ncbi:MAG: SAM-dependent methyltransferase [Pseudomonadota bacterium]
MESTLLSVRLKTQIAREGPISVERYMDACLSDRTAGYYRSQTSIGAGGDFITAPEVSQVFGELLGLWAYAVWQSMGSPAGAVLAELGPGRGTLMADALRAVSNFPGFLEHTQIALVETSPLLRQNQQEALKGIHAPITWCERAEDLPQGPLIVIANEFIDALPIRQLLWRDGQWRERCVGIGRKGGFEFCAGPVLALDALREKAELQHLPDGAILEIRPAAKTIVGSLAAHAGTNPLAALIVDYGHETTECGDTLQAVSRHDFANPLIAPGNVDITAHVDFGALKEAALAENLEVYGPKPQGALLLALGLEARLERLNRTATPEQREALSAGTMRLVDPSAMGLLFKALCVTSKDIPPPPGFDANASK